ncbi:MAG: TIGR03936 family radical SAM-associated protein [Bacillota bacterium]|jgi:radical SAM-linked protein
MTTMQAAGVTTALHTLRLRLQKKDNGRFISHLDLMRAIERTVRRLQLPMALTEGFHPHYRISFGPALPLGASSDAEYCDLVLTAKPEQKTLLEKIGQQLPPGLGLVDGSYVDGQPLSEFITHASYQARLLPQSGDPAAIDELIALGKRILESEKYLVETETRKGLKTIDLRSGIDKARWAVSGKEIVCDLFLAAGSVSNLKPQDALIPFFQKGATLNGLHRSGLYGRLGESLADPFGNVLEKWPESSEIEKRWEACLRLS